jgi:LacI family transcriptional regulator
MNRIRRIALLMSQDSGFHRQVLLGIRAYADSQRGWLFHNAPPVKDTLRPLREWNPHGIIAHLDHFSIASKILQLGKPLVDTACMLEGLAAPVVDVDHTAVGRLAAEYFLTRGYRRVGYFGSGSVRYSRIRESSFRRTVAAAGFEISTCHAEYRPRLASEVSWKSVNQQVQQWLKSLAKPVAILADHDVAAHDLADMCAILGLPVPEEIAILGVDDDELECQLAFPPLSSIAINAQWIGFEAAQLLDGLMSGKSPPAEPLYLPPVRVVTRHSTNLFAVDDPVILAALHYIRNHLTQPIRVNTMADELVIRRRHLEQKFRAVLKRSVLAEIHRARVEKAKELLIRGDQQISQVASQSGFSNAQRLATVFRRLAGMTPREYRRLSQLHVAGKKKPPAD